jgi:HlyD family secretion protein
MRTTFPSRMPRAFAAAVLAWPALLVLSACTRGGEPTLPGYAEAELVHLSSPLGGTLATLAVSRGQRVEAGAELFRLDAESEALASGEAQARVEQAQAQSANLRKGRRPMELQAAEQQLAQARAALAASASLLSRTEQLVQQGFLAAAQLDELRAARDRDAARVRELEAQLSVAQAAARPDEIAAADAQRRAAQQALEQERWRQGQKQRRAPVAGTVFDLPFRPGEWVAPGNPVVVLLPDDGVKLRFFVPQDRLAGVQPGQLVGVGCDGCPAGLQAVVSYVSPQAEFTPPLIYSNESRHKLVFMVEARPAPGSALKPGQPVDVTLGAPVRAPARAIAAAS